MDNEQNTKPDTAEDAKRPVERRVMWRDAKTDPPEAKKTVMFLSGFGARNEYCFGYKADDDADSNLWFDESDRDRDGYPEDVYSVEWWCDFPEKPAT